MLLHFLDELEYTYGEATGLYNNAFPNDQITDEAIRRRHLRCLERLLKRYGPKPVDRIGPVGRKILRRGKPRATRLSGIVREGNATEDTATSVDGGSATGSTSAAAPRRKTLRYTTTIEAIQKKRNMKKHHFETICIVVWRDAEGMEFKAIRERLEDGHNWSVGTDRVKALYYANRDMVHGVKVEDGHSERGRDGREEEAEEGGGDGQVTVTAAAERGGEDGGKDDAEGDVEVDGEDVDIFPSTKKQCVEKVWTGSLPDLASGRST
jgi:hypothetical protein